MDPRTIDHSKQQEVTQPTSDKQAVVFISRRQVALLLGVSGETVRRLTARHVLPAYILGGSIRYVESEILAAMKSVRIPSIGERSIEKPNQEQQ